MSSPVGYFYSGSTERPVNFTIAGAEWCYGSSKQHDAKGFPRYSQPVKLRSHSGLEFHLRFYPADHDSILPLLQLTSLYSLDR
jgi:hypothetical protein